MADRLYVRCRIAFASNPLDASPSWTEVGGVREVHIKRGRNHELDRMEAGTMTVILDNQSGDLWPKNTGGDYYPNIKNSKKINLQAVYASSPTGWIDFFTGYIQSWEPGWLAEGGYGAIMVLQCTDGYSIFSQANINNAGYSAELGGARVGHVADAVSWPAADRAIDAGKTTLQATGALVNINAKNHLQQVQDTELGLVFMSPAGNIIFEDRSHRTISPHTVSQATFGNDVSELHYADLKYVFDKTLVFNDVRVTRTGGAEQVATDSASQTAHGIRTLTRSTLHTSDINAYVTALYLVSRYAGNVPRVDSILLKPTADNSLWPQVMAREISDRITVRKDSAYIDSDFFIEGVQHDWDFTNLDFTSQYHLSDATQYFFTPPAIDITLAMTANGDLDSNTPYPAGDGTNWDRVDEIPYNDGDYVWNPSGGAYYLNDIYLLQDSDYTSGVINSVTIYYRVNTASTPSAARWIIKIGSNYYYGSYAPSSPNYVTYSDTLTVSPATSNAWTWAEVNGMQPGIQLYWGARCSQIYVVVNVTPAW